VADIHFTPNAAMKAAEFVENVRINPGNYADRKKFAVRDYTDNEYEFELERLHDEFKPLVLKCKEYGRSMRIGTNHGSLSDRILNRYGDTPLGMVESALEFARICEQYGYHDFIFSMKSSIAQVMLEAYRLLVMRADKELKYAYPLHLGVTEAGDGDEARVKSSIGIGGLLEDGLGDTIRVSLTEDPVNEVPIGFAIVKKYNKLQAKYAHAGQAEKIFDVEPCDEMPFTPYTYKRRESVKLNIAGLQVGQTEVPRVELKAIMPLTNVDKLRDEVIYAAKPYLVDGAKSEITAIDLPKGLDEKIVADLRKALSAKFVSPLIGVVTSDVSLAKKLNETAEKICLNIGEMFDFKHLNDLLVETKNFTTFEFSFVLGGKSDMAAITKAASVLTTIAQTAREKNFEKVMFSIQARNIIAPYRKLAFEFQKHGIKNPIVIRFEPSCEHPLAEWESVIVESSIQIGTLFADGIGDMVAFSWKNAGHLPTDVASPEFALLMGDELNLVYNILQATRQRISKTEFISCPSCGRTLFDLETTTAKIKARTAHLKGLKIGIMGCIVNGPGEMADADFGYVGTGVGEISLYVGREVVEKHIPTEEAVDRLVSLIKRNGKWREPNEAHVTTEPEMQVISPTT